VSNKIKSIPVAATHKTLQEQSTVAQQTEVEYVTPSKKQGRPPGKRSNPDYEQIGLYIPKRLHIEVKKLLLEYEDKDFSELVSDLLVQWIKGEQV
jgi:hypothetical protein